MTTNDLITKLISVGEKVEKDATSDHDYESYSNRVRTFIRTTFDESILAQYDRRTSASQTGFSGRLESHGKILGYLEGLLAKYADGPKSSEEIIAKQLKYDTSKVFVVHGHDMETKETVARFIQKIGLKPIILHEQPSSGLTIIEKLEANSSVGFAVVLLTPDDIGGLATSPNNLLKRARQNVILELGFFIGKLSRSRVCALYKPGVEIPSDYGSVVFIELDEKGGWHTKLAQEFVQAGMIIEIEGLLEA